MGIPAGILALERDRSRKIEKHGTAADFLRQTTSIERRAAFREKWTMRARAHDGCVFRRAKPRGRRTRRRVIDN